MVRPTLTMTCTLQRFTASGSNRLGGGGSWATVATGVPCNWQSQSGSEKLDDEGSIVGAIERVTFLPDQDVRPRDRITLLVDRRGRTLIDATDYRELSFVHRRPTHREAVAKASS